MTLADIGEHGFLARVIRRARAGKGVEVGPGDDCAVVRAGGTRWALTTDSLVEGVHFRRGWDTPEGLGWRAFAVNASDVAAMGAEPRFALLSLELPKEAAVAEIERFVRGFERTAGRSGCALVGGNLASAPQWAVTVLLIGECPARPLLRKGARPGDGIWVSGTLGGAAHARALLLGGGRVDPRQTRPWRRPVPRLALGRTLSARRLASAAIDVSDGLLQDLGHLCRASGVGAVVDASRLPLPRALRGLPAPAAWAHALAGGEDYELLFTAPPSREKRLVRLGTRVRRIGRIVRGRGVSVADAHGRKIETQTRGYDHFTGQKQEREKTP